MVVDPNLDQGNKMLFVGGDATLLGTPKLSYTNLKETAVSGNAWIRVENCGETNWKVNDWIGITPSTYEQNDYEEHQISAMRCNNNGKVQLKTSLIKTHTVVSSTINGQT